PVRLAQVVVHGPDSIRGGQQARRSPHQVRYRLGLVAVVTVVRRDLCRPAIQASLIQGKEEALVAIGVRPRPRRCLALLLVHCWFPVVALLGASRAALSTGRAWITLGMPT